MILYNPKTFEKMSLRAGNPIAKLLRSEGWTDITPERSHKQVTQSKRFLASGTVARTISCLEQCKRQAKFSTVDTANIDETIAILKGELIKLRRGG